MITFLFNKTKRIFNSILNFFFPQQCMICGRIIYSDKNEYHCSKCKKLLNLNPHTARKGIFLKECWAISHHRGIIKELIYLFKYQNKPYLSTFFGEILADYLKEKIFLNFDLIIPIPLHKRRQEERGYNQSELLANVVSKKLNISVDKKSLKRIKNTISQFELNLKQRKDNIKNAFEIKNKGIINGKTILLIEDISTTGTTLEECSRILKKAKAKEVFSLVISHG